MAEAWRPAQRRLHWWTGGLVATGFAIAWIMVAVPLRDLLVKFLLFQLHKTIGLTVFALVVWRLGLRNRHGRPADADGLSIAERRAAAAGQALLYGLLLEVPILGYLTACSAPSGFPTLFLGVVPIPSVIGPDPHLFDLLAPIHRWSAIILIALAVGHALQAIRHHRRGRLLLRQMWRAPPH